MDVELIYKLGRDNLVSDALNRREELITFCLLVLVGEDLSKVERDFLEDARKTMKYDKDALTKNPFFDERGLKKTRQVIGVWRIKGKKWASLLQANAVVCAGGRPKEKVALWIPQHAVGEE